MPITRTLHVMFDVTDLDDEQIARLAEEAGVQGEANEHHGEAPYKGHTVASAPDTKSKYTQDDPIYALDSNGVVVHGKFAGQVGAVVILKRDDTGALQNFYASQVQRDYYSAIRDLP